MKNSPIFKLAETTLRIQKRHMQSLVKVTAEYVTEKVLRGVDSIRKDNSRQKVKDVIYDALNDLADCFPKAKDEQRERLVALISELMRVCLQASQSLDMMEAKAYLVQFQNEEFPRVIAEIRSCVYETLEENEDSTEIMEWAQQNDGSLKANDDTTKEEGFNTDLLPLPKDLNTQRAQTYFRKAIERNYIEVDNGQFRWIGTNNKGTKAELAYFLGKVYKYKNTISGNAGDSFPEDSLNRLFNVTRLYSSLTQVYNAQKQQNWRTLIDEIFS